MRKIEADSEGFPDLAVLLHEVEDRAGRRWPRARPRRLRAEAAHSAARQALDVARKPLADAERRANRLETEAKTLRKVLHVDSGNLWPSVIDDLQGCQGL